MNKRSSPRSFAVALASALLSMGLGIASISTVGAAGSADLSDIPLQTTPSAKPNVMFTLDDSSSMAADFTPDYVVDSYCRSSYFVTSCGTRGSSSVSSGTYYNYPPYAYTSLRFYTNYGGTTAFDSISTSTGSPPVMASSFNRMYYNPEITYTPPNRSVLVVPETPEDARNFFPQMSRDNTSNWQKVWSNKWWLAAAGATPLTVSSSIIPQFNFWNRPSQSIYCNSTWWDNVNDSSQCRVDMTAYPAGANGAPAVEADYQYPYTSQASSTAPGDPASFSQQYKYLYCDSSKMDRTGTSTVNTTTTCYPDTDPDPACNQSCSMVTVTLSTPSGCGSTSGSETIPIPCDTTQRLRCYKPYTYTTGGTVDYTCKQKYLDDANDPTKGEICRHNGLTYSTAPTGGGVRSFPSGVFTTGTNNCGYAGSIQDHFAYYRTSVKWCNKQLPYYNPRGGFGDASNPANCQDYKDGTHPYVYFYRYLGDKEVPAKMTPSFERVQLNYEYIQSATAAQGKMYPYRYWDAETNTIATKVRPFDDEMTNYANWFAYYRTRALAAKTVASRAFANKDLTGKIRAGFQSLNEHTPGNGGGASGFALSMAPVADFSGGDRTAFFDALQKVPLEATYCSGTWAGNACSTSKKFDTPSLDALTRVGEYFMTGKLGKFSGEVPVQLSCQKNYHIFFTDGATLQESIASPAAGNTDTKVPAQVNGKLIYGQTVSTGGNWPKPIYDSYSNSNTLGDVAMKYWMTPLRDFGNGAAQVPTSAKDPANWPHLNFAALAMGVEGTLPKTGSDETLQKLQAGTLVWPNITVPQNPSTPAQAIDDLWHATVNGFSTFANTQSPDELMKALTEILANVQSGSGTRAGDTYDGVDMTVTGNHYAYRVSFADGWTGDLIKTQVNSQGLMTGDVWKAAAKLNTRLDPATDAAGNPKPWDTNRVVVTYDRKAGATNLTTNRGIPFRYDNLTATQKTALTPTGISDPSVAAVWQKNVIDYLRGSNELEGFGAQKFRPRVGRLGDIVNARPVYVGKPNSLIPYADPLNSGHDAFVSAHQNRQEAVYVAANDGMLHAFNATSGQEMWSYIPSELFRPYNAAATGQDAGLINLTFQENYAPIFSHHYYVDATPRVMEAKIGGSWASLLVGGLGKGGRAYYALDVTEPMGANGGIPSENTIADKVRWEFVDDNLGYTFGRPLIVKVPARGDNWVVIVPSGYNNINPGDGVGSIFVLDAATGEVIKRIKTTSGGNASPSGLAHIAGFTKTTHNQVVSEVYGGDLNGNLWRFDLSGNESEWKAELFAELKNGSMDVQPVTTEPRIEVEVGTGSDSDTFKRWVFVGTGRMLGMADITDIDANNQVQTLYAFRDGTQGTASTIGGPLHRSDLRDATSSYTTGVGAPDKGWYVDLEASYRTIYNPEASSGPQVISFIATSPVTKDPCDPGTSSRVYSLRFGSGASVLDKGARPYSEPANGAVGVTGLKVDGGNVVNLTGANGSIVDSNGSTSPQNTIADRPITGGGRKVSWRTIFK